MTPGPPWRRRRGSLHGWRNGGAALAPDAPRGEPMTQMTRARRPTSADIPALLEATVRHMMHQEAEVLDVTSETITRGVSGAEVRRHTVGVRVPQGPDTVVSLVTKMSDRIERSTLAHLNAQGQPGVPLSHAHDADFDGPDWICLQDLGDEGRPDVLSPLP